MSLLLLLVLLCTSFTPVFSSSGPRNRARGRKTLFLVNEVYVSSSPSRVIMYILYSRCIFFFWPLKLCLRNKKGCSLWVKDMSFLLLPVLCTSFTLVVFFSFGPRNCAWGMKRMFPLSEVRSLLLLSCVMYILHSCCVVFLPTLGITPQEYEKDVPGVKYMSLLHHFGVMYILHPCFVFSLLALRIAPKAWKGCSFWVKWRLSSDVCDTHLVLFLLWCSYVTLCFCQERK